MKLNKNDEIKEWNYIELFNDTAIVYETFNNIYVKDREAARYYILNKNISSTIIKVFSKKNIKILVKEQISYGVSITLKRYKSTKLIHKYYIDISTGLIAKLKNGKFLQCRPNEIDQHTKKYIINEIPWIKFIFDLDLPVTFNTIVTKKLYSTKKLLRWYWSANYQTAIKLNSIKDNQYKYLIRKNIKNINNINNINPKIFDSDPIENNHHLKLFINTLNLAVKCSKKINATWSFNRLYNEYNKLNKTILNKLYENYNKPIIIPDIFKPIINFLLDRNYYIPKDYKELSKLSDREETINCIISNISSNILQSMLIVYKNNLLITIYANDVILKPLTNVSQDSTYNFITSYSCAYESKEQYIFENSNPFKPYNFAAGVTVEKDIQTINKEYDHLLKIYERRQKIQHIIHKN